MTADRCGEQVEVSLGNLSEIMTSGHCSCLAAQAAGLFVYPAKAPQAVRAAWLSRDGEFLQAGSR